MNLNQRQLQLLDILLNTESYITTDELSKIIKFTSRTLKSDLAILKDELKQYDITILYKKGSYGGYLIEKINIDGLNKLKLDLKSKELNFGGYRSEYNQRAFILSRLIINSKGIIKIEDLMEMTKYSRSVINQEMPEIKRRLSRYNIELKALPKQGIKVVGTEYDIRNAMIDLFEVNEDDLSSAYFLDDYKMLDFYKVIQLRQVIHSVFKENGIETSAVLFERIVVAFIITLSRKDIYRSSDEKKDIYRSSDEKIVKSKMFKIVKKILNEAGYTLEKYDLIFLTYYCLSFSFPNNQKKIKDYYPLIYDKCNAITKEVEQVLLEKFGINCNQNSIVRDSIMKMILQNNFSINSSVYSMYFTNEIRDYSRQKQVFVEIAYICLKIISDKYNMTISRYQIYQFILSLDAYFENNSIISNINKTKIKIIPNFDILSAQNYYTKLTKYFNFLDILITDSYIDNDFESIYIAIDNDNINGSNVINVSYEINSVYLIKQIMTKLHCCIKLKYDVLEKYDINNDNIIELKRVIEVNELFTLISSLYNFTPKKQLETFEYIEKRNDVIPYESRKSRICCVPLFNQDICGCTVIKLKKPIVIRNWESDIIFVLSLPSDVELIDVYSKLTCFIAYDNQSFIDCIENIDDKRFIEKLYRKSMVN